MLARANPGASTPWAVVVEVEADDGTTGVGVTIGGAAGAQIVERHLARFVEAGTPATSRVFGWDQMSCSRADLHSNYGRKDGVAMQVPHHSTEPVRPRHPEK